MRALLVILVLANAGFAAWALLVDRPVESPAARDIGRLKRLMLVAEVPAGKASAHPPPAPAAPVASAASSTPGASAPMASSPAAGAAQAPQAEGACVTVGPFEEQSRAVDAVTQLRGRGLVPRQRTENVEDLVEYWVYLGGFATDAAEQRTLRQLHARGLSDAAVMPGTEHGRRLSLGLFSEHARAERRARDARALGVVPQIEEQRHTRASYWVDVTLPVPDQSLSLDGLLPAGAQAATLTQRNCPVPAASSTPKPL